MKLKIDNEIMNLRQNSKIVYWAIFLILFSIPVILVFLPYLTQPKTVLTYDWDYFSQMYEAFRVSVIKYGQFPWFNPWVAGGVPLYANPQFGLVSIQAILVLIFGTLVGLKISIILYALLGMWGIYCLLRYNDTPVARSLMLGYIFAFGGFGVYHITGGHLTFAVYYLIPFLLWSFQRLLKESKWIVFSLIFSLCLLSASHYIILQFMLILFGISILAIWKKPYSKNLKELAIIYLKSFGLILILTAHKIFFAYQYLASYPRLGGDANAVSISTLLRSLIIPPSPYNHTQPAGLNYSWGEYSAYSGIILIFIVIFIFIILFRNKKLITNKIYVVFLIIIGSFLLALGRFSKFSPFNLLGELPVYKSMIAPARWMGWFFFGIILLIGLIKLNKRQEKIVSLLLVVSVLEIAFFTIPYIRFMNPNIKYSAPIITNNTFEQYDDYKKDEYMRYLSGTQSNLGEVRGYEAIINYDLYRPTNRCGVNRGCNFVLTNNAKVNYWSPNKIIISRTQPGEIKLNINPGSYWLVNGKRLWPNYRVVELTKDFILRDNQNEYQLVVSPSLYLSPQ
jgi:hypothetical protein